jgi:hypothetical protein
VPAAGPSGLEDALHLLLNGPHIAEREHRRVHVADEKVIYAIHPSDCAQVHFGVDEPLSSAYRSTRIP